MELVVSLSMRILLGDVRAKLDVRAQRLAKRLGGGQADVVRGGHVQLDEPLPLYLGDTHPAWPLTYTRRGHAARASLSA
jgi:hypothetical protein